MKVFAFMSMLGVVMCLPTIGYAYMCGEIGKRWLFAVGAYVVVALLVVYL